MPARRPGTSLHAIPSLECVSALPASYLSGRSSSLLSSVLGPQPQYSALGVFFICHSMFADGFGEIGCTTLFGKLAAMTVGKRTGPQLGVRASDSQDPLDSTQPRQRVADMLRNPIDCIWESERSHRTRSPRKSQRLSWGYPTTGSCQIPPKEHMSLSRLTTTGK